MPKFPVDAPKTKVVKTLQSLGFEMVREREHISMQRENPDGSKTPLTMPNHSMLDPDVKKYFKDSDSVNNALRAIIKVVPGKHKA